MLALGNINWYCYLLYALTLLAAVYIAFFFSPFKLKQFYLFLLSESGNRHCAAHVNTTKDQHLLLAHCDRVHVMECRRLFKKFFSVKFIRF